MGGDDGGEALACDAEAGGEFGWGGVEEGVFEVGGVGVDAVEADEVGEDEAGFEGFDEGADGGDGFDEALGGAGDASGALLEDGEAGAEADGFSESEAWSDAALGGFGGGLEYSEAFFIGECDGVSEQVGAAHEF